MLYCSLTVNTAISNSKFLDTEENYQKVLCITYIKQRTFVINSTVNGQILFKFKYICLRPKIETSDY